MNYPLISEYVEAIMSAEDNFEELSYLRPVLDNEGLPVMTSGNFAVVFKMKNEQNSKLYAVKCFTKDQNGRAEAYSEITKELIEVSSPYLVSIRYLDKELFVDTNQTQETEFPVLLMDWVEGKALDKYVRENLGNRYALEMLSYRFSQLAQWLIPQPFAHGDLKPDNILVREDGTLVLVDYDGMYVPAMNGQKAREIGSNNFRHPLRSIYDFNEHVDDFSFVSILISIKALSIKPSLLKEFGSDDRLLFSDNDYRNLGSSDLMKEILSIASIELQKLSSLMLLVCCDCIIQPSYLDLITIRIPVPFMPIIEEVYNDTPYKFSLYDVYNKKCKSKSFDYVSFVDASLKDTNSCVVCKDLAPIEDMYSSRPIWPWTGSILYNAAIVACADNIDNPIWYESIERLQTNSNLFIAVTYQQKYGLIDDNNHIVIDFCYSHLEAIEDGSGHLLATNVEGLSGIIDQEGNTIIDFQYKITEEIKGGYYLCKKGNLNLLLSPNGEEIPIDYNGSMIHFGKIAVGISSPKEFVRKTSNGTSIPMNEYVFYVFHEGKVQTTFTVSFRSSWRNWFKMTSESQIVAEHFSSNPDSYTLIPETFIDLEGKCHAAPRYSSWLNNRIQHTKENNDTREQNNIWLANFVKEKYLRGLRLPYDDGNMPTSYKVTTIGNIALVSYSWYSLMYPDDGGYGYLGYADENMCYW